MTSAVGDPSPVVIEATVQEGLSRWLWLVKWVLAIPHYLVLIFLWVAFVAVSVVALVGDGPVDEVLAGFAHGALTPTRYFTEEESARSWVEGWSDSAETGPAA